MRSQPVIANAEQQILKSAVTGTEYEIDVALPRGYTASNKRYQVLYTLDGNAYFSLLTDTVRLLQVIDDLIVVGIGYPVKTYAWWGPSYVEKRTHDYTTRPAKPSVILRKEQGEPGGAPTFLRFLREELIPYIDSTYRTISGERGLVGHSFGGLFVVYVLTHEPDTFRNYVIGSPSLWWDDGVSFQWESQYAASHKELPARIYTYIGCSEGDIMTVPAQQLRQQLLSRRYKGLDLVDDGVCVPDESHLSVNISSIERALKSFYGRRPMILSTDVLKRYVGEWTIGKEPALRIRLNRDRLLLDVPGSSMGPRELLALSETTFATNMTYIPEFSLTFKLDPSSKGVMELKLSQQPYFEAGEVRPARSLLLHKVH